MVTAVIIKIFALALIVLPVILLTVNREKKAYGNIFLFFAFYLAWSFFNSPLREYGFNIDLIESQWNWEGKILALIFSIVFIIIFRNRLGENFFFTLKQKKGSGKPVFIVTGIIIIVAVLFNLLTPEKTALNHDSLLFQISMPALDEETAFRGIMLGLLLNSLNRSIIIGKTKLFNPSILITAILFGLIHGLPFSPEPVFTFDAFAFIYTFLFGLIWGWMTVRSRSILAPVLSHGITNFAVTLITMLK